MFMKNAESDTGILVASPSRSTKTNCWSCGDMRAAQFCRQCGKVQPPAPVDYFAFFGLSYRLNLDVSSLEREFYSLSLHLHPDSNAVRTQQEQQWSLEQSSSLNDAFRTLKDPIARTEYLLRLQGLHPEEQSTAATEEARRTGQAKKQAVPPDLLEDVFELNMQLEEARMNRKMGETDRSLDAELRVTKKNLQGRYDGMMDELQRAWTAWDGLVDCAERGGTMLEEDRVSVLDKMLALLNRRSYVRNLLRDVDEVLE